MIYMPYDSEHIMISALQKILLLVIATFFVDMSQHRISHERYRFDIFPFNDLIIQLFEVTYN